MKSNSLCKKSKGVPIPFHMSLLDLSLCDEITKPNALIPSLSRSKLSREWHQHLTSQMGEVKEFNPNMY